MHRIGLLNAGGHACHRSLFHTSFFCRGDTRPSGQPKDRHGGCNFIHLQRSFRTKYHALRITWISRAKNGDLCMRQEVPPFWGGSSQQLILRHQRHRPRRPRPPLQLQSRHFRLQRRSGNKARRRIPRQRQTLRAISAKVLRGTLAVRRIHQLIYWFVRTVFMVLRGRSSWGTGDVPGSPPSQGEKLRELPAFGRDLTGTLAL